MMSLLSEIRADLIDDSAKLTNTLRKAQMLAQQLDLPELGDWVTSELEGYQNDDVPEYRLLYLPVYGEFPLPMQGRTETVNISSNLPQQLRDKVQELAVTYKMSILEEMLASDDKESHREFTKEFTDILRQVAKMSDGTQLQSAYQRFPHVFLAGILDSVKSRLLSSLKDLDDIGVPHETTPTTVHINVSGNNNIVAAGHGVNQTVSTINKGDVESLMAHLRAHNIDEEDLDELASAVVSEPQLHSSGFGSKVAGWIGKMVGKKLSGAWKYTGDNAQVMLTEAVNGFYGI